MPVCNWDAQMSYCRRCSKHKFTINIYSKIVIKYNINWYKLVRVNRMSIVTMELLIEEYQVSLHMNKWN